MQTWRLWVPLPLALRMAFISRANSSSRAADAGLSEPARESSLSLLPVIDSSPVGSALPPGWNPDSEPKKLLASDSDMLGVGEA